MWDKILEILAELAPLWWIIGMIIISLGMKFYYSRFKKTEDIVDKLPCSTESYRIEHAETARMTRENNESIKKHTDILNTMSLDIRHLLTLANANPQSDQNPTLKELPLAVQNSPRVMTDFGKQVCIDSGVNDFYATYKDLLIKDIEYHNPRTKLDVETQSLRVLLLRLDEDIFKPLKDWVYENPYIDIPEGDKMKMTIDNILMLISLKLRDEYIELKNIN